MPWEAKRWLALCKHVTVSCSSECWDLLKCWDRLQNVSTQTGVVGDLLTILRFHCKHYDSKEATVGLHFLIKFISLKRTWNAKSWHLKWKFAKLPPIPHNAILLSPPPPSNAITIFSFHTNDFWSKYFLPPRVRLWSVVNKQYFVDAPSPPSLQLSYITVPGVGGGVCGWSRLTNVGPQQPAAVTRMSGGHQQGGHQSSTQYTGAGHYWWSNTSVLLFSRHLYTHEATATARGLLGQNVNDCWDAEMIGSNLTTAETATLNRKSGKCWTLTLHSILFVSTDKKHLVAATFQHKNVRHSATINIAFSLSLNHIAASAVKADS